MIMKIVMKIVLLMATKVHWITKIDIKINWIMKTEQLMTLMKEI